jgi:OmcA/MtrC family decaheme c-type cytochrome
MIRNNLQAARGKHLILLMVLLSLVIPVWAQTQGEDREQGQDLTRREDQFRSLTAASQPSAKPESNGYTKHQLGYYLDPNQVSFVRPGLKFTIQNVIIGSDNKIRVTYLITDNNGLPLDRLGVVTPGAVSTSFVAAYIPKGQSQYLAYTTRTQTSPITGVSAVQAAADTGGTQQQVGEGTYTYTFGRALPANYDTTVTHTVVLYGNRNLSEFDLGTQYSNVEYHWVPSGAAVTQVRDVVRTETCNKCHDPLALHGGSRRNVATCVTCHTPQTADPDTGNTVDLKVMVHKIHAGPNLPSVKAGKPYVIIGNQQSVNDFSQTTFPQELNNCQSCHDGTASQAMNWMTKPTRATCGSCHDDVNFATGQNHPAGAQPSDNLCANCHIPEGELEFDASIKGAHTVPRYSQDLPGVKFEILEVKNTQPGQKPNVTLKITDKSEFPIETSQMNSLSLVIAGPNTDYAAYWSENVLTTPSNNGIVNYTFTRGIPADAKGSFSVAVQGYRNITLQSGTTKEMVVRDAGFNQVVAFAVTDPVPVARRNVVAQGNCNSCHGNLALHGGSRQNVQFCVMCHNANGDDKARRPADQLPTESIHLKTMVHKIHTGEELDNDFTIYGFGNVPVNFNEVTFPGDRRNCEKCHIADTQQLPLPKGLLPTVAPRDYINPMQPIQAACLTCHTSQEAASHALLNTSTLGESCRVCHGTTSEFSVDKVHAR